MTDLTPAIRATGLLTPGRPLVALVSGGRDSVCLLDVAVRVSGPEAVTALHVNYGLRGGEADADEAHCRSLGERLGVAVHVHRTGRAPATGSGNLQAWARAERYAAARGLADARGPHAEIATGHTATDQLETILYRLASSPSRRALRGMRAREPGVAPLLRPLLGASREQTAAHCRARGLTWRDDASNAGDRFARSRIRHELVPALERVHPAATANVLALAELLAAEGAVLDELVESVLAADPAATGAAAGDPPRVSVAGLAAQPPALRRLIVQRLADATAGEPAAGVARRADDVAALPLTGTAVLDLPHRIRVTADAGVIAFTRTPPRPPSRRP